MALIPDRTLETVTAADIPGPNRYGLAILDQANLPDRGAQVRRMMVRQIDQMIAALKA